MTRDPQDCCDMAELRGEIDRIDGALVALLARRAACIDRAVALKRAAGLPAHIEDRVAQVIANARAGAAAEGLDPDLAEALWARIVAWSIAREERALAAEST